MTKDMKSSVELHVGLMFETFARAAGLGVATNKRCSITYLHLVTSLLAWGNLAVKVAKNMTKQKLHSGKT